MILDTTFIIDLMRGEVKAVNRLHRLLDDNTPQILPAPVVFELCTGIARSKFPKKEHQKIQNTIESMLCIQLEPSVAAKAGMIQGDLISKGKPIGALDCMIAATAMDQGTALLTRNSKHFEIIKDLKIETY